MNSSAKRAKVTWSDEANGAYLHVANTLETALAKAPRLTMSVQGPPVAKGRPRATVAGGRARLYTPAETERYEAHLRKLLHIACLSHRWPVGGWSDATVRYVMQAEFVIERDVEDVDNLLKAAADASNGIVYPDDRRVCFVLAARRVAALEEDPHASLRFWALGTQGALP